MNSNVTYHQQVSYCGKPRCRKCREGIGHGPYWYAYRTENGRTIRTYIGKHLPVDVQEPQERISSDPDPLALLIRALGQFRLERREGQEWRTVDDATWQHQRIRALLALLLSSPGRKMGREQVMDMLWPELDIETAASRLDRSVHSLRQLLEPSLSRPALSRLLRMEREGLILADQSLVWIDADAFEQLIALAHSIADRGEAEQLLEQAITLYEGDFLPEEKHADWISTRREVLQRKWMGLLLDLADRRINRGLFASVIDLLDRLLAADSANEAAVQRLIVALAQLDRRGEALRAYHRFATTLQHDYNIAPLPETRDLFEAIQHGDTELIFPLQSQQAREEAVSSERDRAGSPGPSYKVQIGRSHQHPLIGRDEELEVMRHVLLTSEPGSRAQSANRKPPSLLPRGVPKHPQCILLVGEAGIGKTRLAEELSHEAQKRGWVIAWSRVYAQESSVPYRQWTEVLRNAMASGFWQRQEMSKHPLVYQPLSTLLPELHDVLPREAAFPSPLSPEQEQLRLWEAAHKLLTTISERTPLLLVLDDFHWADASSCELFAYLARRLHGYPIILIGTYRDNELPVSNPLRSLLTDLQREQVIVSLPIQPLSDEQIGSLISHLPGSMVQYIQTRAAGNPFFAEELARSVASTAADANEQNAQPLPDTIAAVLELRMSRLTGACQRLLSNASVLGGSFTFQTFSQLEASGANSISEDAILDLLEEALQAGVLTEEGTGTRISYHFWHPLLVSHLYDQLSAARRARLHRRAAAVLQHIHKDRQAEAAAAITNHLLEGGAGPDQVLHYAGLAADRAYALSAYPEAEQYYRIAVNQLDEQASASFTIAQQESFHLAYLLERLGECARIRGNYGDARHMYERVLDVRSHQRNGASPDEYQLDAQIDAILWREIGLTWYDVGDNINAQQCCERGEEVLQQAEVVGGPAWAILRFQEGYMNWQEGRYEEARLMAQEAMYLFEEALTHQERSVWPASQLTVTKRTLLGAPLNLGRTHTLLGLIANSVGQSIDALAHLNTALALFEQYDYQREIANTCCSLSDIHLKKAEHEMAQSYLRRSLSLAQRLGDVPLMSVVFSNMGVLATRSGNLREAEAFFKQSLALAEQINDQVYISLWNVVLAPVLQDQGRLLEAEACISRALSISRLISIAPYIGFGLVALGNLHITRAMKDMSMIQKQIGQGDHKLIQNSQDRHKTPLHFLKRAQKVVERALAIAEIEAETKIGGQLSLAHIYLLLNKRDIAYKLAINTLEEARRYELVWESTCTQRLLGDILAAQGHQEQAEHYFEQAMQTFRTCDMRLEYGRTLHSYAISLLGRKKSARRALDYLHEAQQIFNECHAALDQQMVERELALYERKA